MTFSWLPTNRETSLTFTFHSGVMLIAKFCVNTAFFGYHVHFGHIAASPYTIWLTTDWTSYGSLWLPHHSVIKDRTATQLMIFGVISAGVPHSSPPCTTSPVNEGRNLNDDKINVLLLAAIIFRLLGDAFSPQVLSLHRIVGNALSENEICILFWRRRINLKPNPNETIPRKRLGLPVSDWPEIMYLAKPIGDIFQLINKRHNPRNGIWNEPACL